MKLGQILGVARKPIQGTRAVLDREVAEAHEANHALSKGVVIAVAAAALFALVEDIVSGFMAFSFYSTLQDVDFATYHKWTPVMHIAGAFAFMFAVYMKKVTYWLVYAIPIILIIHDVVLAGLINGWISPEDIWFFDFGPAWWKSG